MRFCLHCVWGPQRRLLVGAPSSVWENSRFELPRGASHVPTNLETSFCWWETPSVDPHGVYHSGIEDFPRLLGSPHYELHQVCNAAQFDFFLNWCYSRELNTVNFTWSWSSFVVFKQAPYTHGEHTLAKKQNSFIIDDSFSSIYECWITYGRVPMVRILGP